MTWCLVDPDGIVVNFIRWDGETEYDPQFATAMPWKDGLEIGGLYESATPTAALNVNLNVSLEQLIKPVLGALNP